MSQTCVILCQSLCHILKYFRLFSSRKLKQQKQTNIGDGVQSKILRDKLMELETEIERFRSENAALTKLRKEREEVMHGVQFLAHLVMSLCNHALSVVCRCRCHRVVGIVVGVCVQPSQ